MNKKIKGAGGGGGKGGGGGGGGRVAQESPDSLRSISYAQVLDLVSEGEIEGLANGLKSVYFNNTPLQNDNGTYNFTDTTVTLVNGTQSQSHIAGFPAVENENIVGVQVEKSGSGIVRQITNSDVDAVRVRVSVPQLTSQNTTNGDISGTTVQYAVDIQSNGGGYIPQVLGSAWDSTKVTIVSATSLKANTPVYQIKMVTIDDSNAAVYTAQYKLQSSEAWLTEGIQESIDSVINRSYEEMEWVDSVGTTTVKTFTMPVKDNGLWEMRLVVTSGAPWINNSSSGNYGTTYATITGKTTSKYERSHRIQLTGSAPWDIRVRRITDDSTASSLQNKTYFEAYTEIIDGKFRYPNSAIVGVRIDSSQFNSIPTRAYDLKLLKIKVPSNYDPTTRVYTGIWDGTFKVVWSDNPAWCFYDLITNTRYGLGEFIDPAQVDKWTLYAIGQYCDQMIDDGKGGTEPRYTCNLYLQNRDEAYTVVNSMASIFRGMPYWSSGSLTMGYDAPADPEYQFTNANVVDGTFNYAGSSLKARHTVALVTWNDPEDNFRQKVEYVEDADSIARYGIIQTEVVAVGCTSRGQANRVGRWILFTEKSETEMVTFKTGLEGNPLRPSQIIQVADELRAGLRRGGRIASATTTDIVIDDVNLQNQTGVIGGTISVILPDGSLETRNISNFVNQTITCSSGFSDAPQPNAIWLVETNTLQSQLFRVISVAEEQDGFSVSALEHNPNKYDEIETGVNLSDRKITVMSATPDMPANLTATESLFIVGSDTNVKVTLSWSSVAGATGYEVSYRIGSDNRVIMPITQALSVDFPVAIEGVWYFKVIAINSLGKRSVPAELTQTIDGKAGLYAVNQITDLVADTQSVIASDGTVQNGIVLTWTAPLENFVNEYEVQWTKGSGNDDWGSIADSAITNVNYGFINDTETLDLDYGFITNAIPTAEGGFNSRFTSQTYFTIQPADIEIPYLIRVRAINDIGVKSEFVSIEYTSYGDTTAPALPTNLSIVSGYKQLIVKWTNPTDLDFDAVDIYRNIVDNSVSAQKIGSVKGSSFVDSGLEINTTYYYWLKSVDRSKNKSAFTSMIAGTTAFIDSDQFSQEVMNLFSEAGAYGIEPVATLPATGDFDGQIKYDKTANKLYRWDAATNAWTDDIFSITTGSVDIASFASGIEPVGIVTSLPSPTGYTGAKIVFLTTDNKIYRYTGTEWTSAIPASDINGTLASENFSNTLRPVEIVETLPSTGNFVGRTAVLTTDGKLYRYTDVGWSVSVETTDLSGTISAAQISANAITADKLDVNAVTAAKISAGAITADKILSNAVTSDKLNANSVIAGKIAAAAVSTTELAANAISSDKIKAGAIIADKIAAGAIQTDKIAANSITAGLIAAAGVITTSAQINNGLITNAHIQNLAVTTAKIQDLSVSTLKIGNNAVSVIQFAKAYNYGNVVTTVTINASDIPSGQTTVPIIVVGSRDIGPTAYYFDMAVNPTSLYNVGNLVSSFPPASAAGVQTFQTVYYAAVGTHSFYLYDHGTPYGSLPYMWGQTISIQVGKR